MADLENERKGRRGSHGIAGRQARAGHPGGDRDGEGIGALPAREGARVRGRHQRRREGHRGRGGRGRAAGALRRDEGGHIEATVRSAVEEFGRLDIMLNVAGIAAGAGIVDITQESYERTMDVDLRGVLFGT